MMTIRVLSFSILIMTLSGCAFSNKQFVEKFENLDLEAYEVEKGVIVTLPDVFFDFDQHRLNPDARVKVQQIGGVLNERRALSRDINISGYADAIGNPEYNLELSNKRARVVEQELIFSQVGAERILATQGFGEQFPIAPNKNPDGSDNPAGRAQNRRVEVLVLNPR